MKKLFYISIIISVIITGIWFYRKKKTDDIVFTDNQAANKLLNDYFSASEKETLVKAIAANKKGFSDNNVDLQAPRGINESDYMIIISLDKIKFKSASEKQEVLDLLNGFFTSNVSYRNTENTANNWQNQYSDMSNDEAARREWGGFNRNVEYAQ